MASGEREAFTVGVEEEYQLVSRDGELASRARHVLAADWGGEIQAEAHETMLEIGTHVCRSAAELAAELRRLRLQVASTAATEELRVVAAAMHPFSSWREQLMTRGKRYDEIRERFGRVVRTELVFGMHIHVGIPEAIDRMPLIRAVRWYTPHLLALSCSSPFYEGTDTGYSSYRNVLWRRLPLTGPVPAVENEAEYERLVKMLVDAGMAMDPGTMYWAIRPHPEYRTIEFRVSDVCPRVDDAVAIAALARALTAATAAGRLPALSTGLADGADAAVISANEWTVARYGLEAKVLDPAAPGVGTPVREWIGRLVEEVREVAGELGDAEALAGVERILERGNAADRMREVELRCRSMPEVVDWLAGESLLGTGLDRRLEQREPCEPGVSAT